MPTIKMRLKRLLFSISSLIDLGQEATSAKDLSEKMKAALYVITGTFSVPAAALFVYNPQRKHLDFLAEKGYRDADVRTLRLSVRPGDIKSFAMNSPHDVKGAAKNPFFKVHEVLLTRLHIRMFIPLFAKG